jgi:hypothetical protein
VSIAPVVASKAKMLLRGIDGLRHVDRGAGLRHQTDQDGGRQQRQQDETTHDETIPLSDRLGTARL